MNQPATSRTDLPKLPRRRPTRVPATSVRTAVTPEVVRAIREWADRDG